MLGELTRTHKGLCVAGTHGKTTTSAMCAHIMHQSHLDCNAFLFQTGRQSGRGLVIPRHKKTLVEEIAGDGAHADAAGAHEIY